MPMHKLSSLSSDDLAELMAQAAAKAKNAERDGTLPPSSDGSLPPFSDEALALRFAERHAGDLRFVAAWGKWLTWDGRRWRIDDTVRAFDYARSICREAAAHCNQRKLAFTIASGKTVAAIERLARADRRLAATVDQWDADPWALNTPDGVIDLRTGKMRPHRAEDYITQITAVAPGDGCPLFLAFLARITDNDAALVSYLQRVLGLLAGEPLC